MTHLSADVDFVQVGWAVGLTALAGCHRDRRAVRGVHRGEIPRNPGGLEIARAVSHFLLMRSYIAGGVQINLMEVEKLYRNGVSRVVFYILLSRLILVTMWNSRSNSGVRSHLAWGKHTFDLPRSLLASWEAQGIRLTSWFVDAVVWSRRKSGTERAETSIRGNLCNVVGTGVGSIL